MICAAFYGLALSCSIVGGAEHVASRAAAVGASTTSVGTQVCVAFLLVPVASSFVGLRVPLVPDTVGHSC